MIVTRPRARRRVLVLSALLITCSLLMASVRVFAPAAEGSVVLDAEEQRVLDLINELRADHGLEDLTLSIALDSAAAWMAEDLTDGGPLSHTDSQGREIRERFNAFGYSSQTTIRENIAAGYPDSAAVVQGWIDSPPHYANLLADDVRAVGIARVDSPAPGEFWYWVLDMGSEPDGGAEAPSEVSTTMATVTGVSGDVPTGGGIGVLTLDDSTSPESVVGTLSSGGCAAPSIWVSTGGTLVGYRQGAPSFVNAAFPSSLTAGTPFIAVCN